MAGKRSGFTLIELIVVIAIIAVLAAVVAPNAFKAIEKSKISKTQRDLVAIKTAIGSLYADTGRFPNGCPAFAAANPEVSLNNARAGLIRRPPVGVVEGSCEWAQGAVDAWDGPYLDKNNVQDFWHTSYISDPDYAVCLSAGACPAAASVRAECLSACGGGFTCAPPVIVSYGPDKTQSCDDIIVRLTAR